MMRKSLLWTALAAGMLQTSLVVAEEAAKAEAPAPDWTVAGSVSFVSDYIFRGQSQTWGKPAAQLGVEVNHKSGLYAGFFASNVSDQWLPGANMENDLYAGFRGSLPGPASDIGFDVGGIYYIYPGADWDESGFNPPAFPAGTTRSNSLNTFEIYGSLSYKFLSFKIGRTLTEYFGWNDNNSGIGAGFNGDLAAGVKPGGDTKGSYFYELNAAYEVVPTWTVSGQIGRQVVADSRGLDITYYKAGVTKGFDGGWSVGAFYSATNEPDAYENFLSLRNTISDSDIAKDKLLVSVSKSF